MSKPIDPISFMEMLAIEAKKFSDLINVHTWNRREISIQGKVMQYMYDKWIGSTREVSTEKLPSWHECDQFNRTHHQ
jgi:hypothetical protein